MTIDVNYRQVVKQMNYSNSEKNDMIVIYDSYGKNAREAAWMYYETYPKIFINLEKNLRQETSFEVFEFDN